MEIENLGYKTCNWHKAEVPMFYVNFQVLLNLFLKQKRKRTQTLKRMTVIEDTTKTD